MQLKGTFFLSNEGVHTLIRLNNTASHKAPHAREKLYLSDLYQKTTDAFVFIDEEGKIINPPPTPTNATKSKLYKIKTLPEWWLNLRLPMTTIVVFLLIFIGFRI